VAIRLTGINLYPIKSARGIPLQEWEVDDFGLRHDRRFMLVDRSGDFITQRDQPRMALIVPELTDGKLRVNAPGMPPLEVALEPQPTVVTRVNVWDDYCDASWLGETPARWFSDFLGTACSLVHMPRESRRPTNPAYDTTGSRVSFADAFPFLIISEESLADLNTRMGNPLPMNRFRPNLTLSGAGPYREDRWTRITVGSLTLNVVKPCFRCVITTTDQLTAERGAEPLRTLARYRIDGGKVWFGQNAVHLDQGRLRIGDEVVIRQER
jgi:MOSC domain-containing protein